MKFAKLNLNILYQTKSSNFVYRSSQNLQQSVFFPYKTGQFYRNFLKITKCDKTCVLNFFLFAILFFYQMCKKK
jgi:hypothetical protein